MGFFKPSRGAPSDQFVAWLQGLIWVLIYGGLLTLVLGLSVAPIDDDTGWSLIVGGGVGVAVGVVLIFVRSRMNSHS